MSNDIGTAVSYPIAEWSSFGCLVKYITVLLRRQYIKNILRIFYS
ncbi:MAG TPA: hypothetical protein VFV86_12815 [Nitrososphaeraceae archaeon]|nr:hypothetical protein [Nitrososphaeraceae archaeon]